MAVHEIIPSSNVLAVDIRDTLRLGTNALEQLCSSDNVNMWARYKPHNYRAYFLTKAEAGTHAGIKVPDLSVDVERLKTNFITWDKPLGGDLSPFRLADFAGYYHRASPRYMIHYPSDLAEAVNRDSILLFDVSPDDELSVRVRDIFANPHELYFGCCIKQKGRTWYKTCEGTMLNDGHLKINTTQIDLTIGTCEIIPFITDYRKPNWVGVINRFYALADNIHIKPSAIVEVKGSGVVVKPPFLVFLEVTGRADNFNVKVFIDATDEESKGGTMTDMKLIIDGGTNNVQTIILGNQTCGNNQRIKIYDRDHFVNLDSDAHGTGLFVRGNYGIGEQQLADEFIVKEI